MTAGSLTPTPTAEAAFADQMKRCPACTARWIPANQEACFICALDERDTPCPECSAETECYAICSGGAQ